ncbi:Leucine-rich repeat protein kinase family protein [Rhynchospora pubera]|uniref:non-specific serine/threonine protein kinase n=1 Tax=Rhynchospora pubera TaxID=906938 RepID=A0AAV8F700_9POAL|nr:Leucine-rich repeat protein kinase family protein [Rhynchospora pubera]
MGYFRRQLWCSYCRILLLVLVFFVCVQGQMPSPNGFISIDCGLASKTSYVDSVTGLTYVSDDGYIDTGVNSNISGQYTLNENYTTLETLRSFPSNIKNCYTLKPVTQGLKYLVRATFYYGNYDYTGKLPSFDLYFGVNFWTTVFIPSSSEWIFYEIIAIAPANYIEVCLVNTQHGNPFISVLELRPINNTLYEADSKKSLNNTNRNDIGSNNTNPLRYPQDALDRQWISWTADSWTAISTSSFLDGYDFEVPLLVLQTAAVPSSANGSIDITWSASDESTNFYVVLHIAEIQVKQNNRTREFYVYANGEPMFDDPFPIGSYLSTSYATFKVTGRTDYNMSLKSTARATLPPIINAFELHTILPVVWLPTDSEDVTAISSIKMNYSIRKGWNGDPCVPPSLNWTDVNCSIDSFNIPRITAINLSSSGLNGTIIPDFGSLISLERLDLSHNNLSGNIPGSMDKLVSLTYLDISGNSGLSGQLPSGLQQKLNDGHLTVISESTVSGARHKNSSKVVIIVVVIVVVFLILGAAATLFFLYLKKNKKTRINTPTGYEDHGNYGVESSSNVHDNPKGYAVFKAGRQELNINKKSFSFAELKRVTNNFREQIGVGGFGQIFKGRLDNGIEVAVKVRSESSSQGIQQFLNEVESLSRIHHKNLLSLIGYCKDGDHIALVYEYMEKGNLEGWIRGSAHSLPWKQRLRIAYESAQGLEYLHKMCNPPLIHRDVKTSNILLTRDLEAKVSDFGLVRDFSGTHVSTRVVGTPGYLDPNFGVVMLEMITSKSPILQGPEGGQHLTQFVQQRLSKGNIESILEPNMGGEYNINSVWKVADLALRCTDQPDKRPDMTTIVTELKETLTLEMNSTESSSMASKDKSQYVYSGYSRNEYYYVGGEVHSGNIEIAQLPDSGPVAR